MGSAINALVGGKPTASASVGGAIGSFLAAAPQREAAYQATQTSKTYQPQNIKDVPTLNKALRGGFINKAQWMQRYKQLNPIKSNINPYSAKSIGGSLAGALNEVLVKPTVTAATQASAELAATPLNPGPKPQQIIEKQAMSAQKQLIAKGVSPKEAEVVASQVRTKGYAGLLQQAGIGINDSKAKIGIKAAENIGGTVASAIPAVRGETVVQKSLGKALAPARAAIGRDEATNALIDAQKVSKATKTAKTADKLGTASVKEASTQRVPVVSPTETAAARKSVGTTAIQNADRSSIPVKGESSQVVGKVKTPPVDYVKKSNALSKAYEKESAALQGRNSPYAQRVLQDNLDRKYAALHKSLDDSYGQTSISFTGKSTKVPGQIELPSSALDKEPRFQPSEVPVSATNTKTVPEPVSKTAPASVNETRVAGSSLRTQAKAIEAGMQSEAQTTGATYSTVSHKEEAAKAAQLVATDPAKARSIAMGARGDNASHEAAVYHAVANKALDEAKRTGDYSEVTALANSPRHTGVSEAAQKLGAEGYNANPHDPINIMNDLAKTREAAIAKTASKPTLAKETANISSAVKAAAPKISRQDWHSFIQELQCK